MDATQKPRLSTECPTPTKVRFATQEAADLAVHRASFEMNKKLYTYDTCPCGWIHLTSKESRVSKVPSLTGIAVYSDALFDQVVQSDVRGLAHAQDVAALRHPENLQRWNMSLRRFKKDVEAQLAARMCEDSDDVKQWRVRVTVVNRCISERLDECKALITQFCAERAEKNREAKRQRHEAGERAVARLIAAHRAEFNRYLAEECAVEGVELPQRIQRHIEVTELEGKKEG